VIPFEYVRARDAAGAVAAVAEHPRAAFLAGGTNLVDNMKLGVEAPERIVDVTGLNLDAVDTLPAGGLRIGAGVRNADLAAHPEVRRTYPLLSKALLSGASGQLRNLATTGGNLLQRTRCPYFRHAEMPCNKREPGTGCSALGGVSDDRAVLGASEHCVATHPSDMATAMCALDAEAVVQGPDGERRVPVERLHRLPGDEPHRDTVLEPADLITAVELPPAPENALSDYYKARERASFAFALASVAVEAVFDGGTVASARIAFGGVAHKPWRARRAEEALTGHAPTEEAARAAAAAELAGASPLEGDEFKTRIAAGALTTVLGRLAGRAGEGRDDR